jgi:hypothetical protein
MSFPTRIKECPGKRAARLFTDAQGVIRFRHRALNDVQFESMGMLERKGLAVPLAVSGLID